MKRETHAKVAKVLDTEEHLAVVVMESGAWLAWKNTLMPDYRFPVDVFDGVTHNKIHRPS